MGRGGLRARGSTYKFLGNTWGWEGPRGSKHLASVAEAKDPTVHEDAQSIFVDTYLPSTYSCTRK